MLEMKILKKQGYSNQQQGLLHLEMPLKLDIIWECECYEVIYNNIYQTQGFQVKVMAYKNNKTMKNVINVCSFEQATHGLPGHIQVIQ